MTYINEDYALFEAYIGMDYDDTKNRRFTTRYSVLGDGKELFRARVTSGEDAMKISVPIRGASGITLKIENLDEKGDVNVYWADAVLVKFVEVAPPPQSPDPALVTPPSVTPRRAEKMTVFLFPDGANISIEEQALEFGLARPVIANGRLLVPLRPLFEAVGARVRFDSNTSKIVADRGDMRVEMQINSRQATINGVALALEQAPVILNGSAYVPVRFVSKAFGIEINVRDSR